MVLGDAYRRRDGVEKVKLNNLEGGSAHYSDSDVDNYNIIVEKSQMCY